MNSDRRNELTVVVASCDAYADLLGPFAALWRRFWPDCPFETVLVTETAPASPAGFDRIVACGKGGSWCSRLVTALGRVATPYVLLLCDDYYLAEKVDTARFLARLDEAKRFGAANLRLIPNPVPGKGNSSAFGEGTDLLRYRPSTAYAIATQAGIWERDFLRSLAEGRSSIWEFERYGSFDPAIAGKKLLVTPVKEFPFLDAVHKGCWETWGLEVCRANGVDLSGISRTLPPLRTRLVEGLKHLVFAVVPNDWIVRVQNRFDLGAKERGPAK